MKDDAVRCPARTEGGTQQCGLWKGHPGTHTLLHPTGYPWFGQPPLPLPADIEEPLDRLAEIVGRAAEMRG